MSDAKVVHFEVPAQDTGRAQQFWGSLFDLNFETYEGPVEYHMFQNEDRQSGGAVMPADGGEKGLKVYFNTDNIDATLQKIKELGGSAEDKQPVPGMGWFAPAKDTEGNAFSIWQSDPNAPGAS